MISPRTGVDSNIRIRKYLLARNFYKNATRETSYENLSLRLAESGYENDFRRGVLSADIAAGFMARWHVYDVSLESPDLPNGGIYQILLPLRTAILERLFFSRNPGCKCSPDSPFCCNLCAAECTKRVANVIEIRPPVAKEPHVLSVRLLHCKPIAFSNSDTSNNSCAASPSPSLSGKFFDVANVLNLSLESRKERVVATCYELFPALSSFLPIATLDVNQANLSFHKLTVGLVRCNQHLLPLLKGHTSLIDAILFAFVASHKVATLDRDPPDEPCDLNLVGALTVFVRTLEHLSWLNDTYCRPFTLVLRKLWDGPAAHAVYRCMQKNPNVLASGSPEWFIKPEKHVLWAELHRIFFGEDPQVVAATTGFALNLHR